MRKPSIFGNWKMNKGPTEARQFASSLVSKLAKVVDRQIAIFPPYTSIPAVAGVLKGSNLHYGGQNVSYEPPGAYTGEIALDFLVELGCDYVLIGHSERRAMGEDDKLLNRKLKKVGQSDIIPVLCIGEKLEERETNKTFEVLEKQLKISLEDVALPFIIAYEPVWAIGTGRTATPQQAAEVHSFIREKLGKSGYPGDEISILYGGSVKPHNIDELMRETEIDGALVGGASLDVEQFTSIVNFREK